MENRGNRPGTTVAEPEIAVTPEISDANRVNGNTSDHATPPPTPKKPRRLNRWIVLPAIFAVLLIGGLVGYRYWEADYYYVSTDNAQVTGSLVQVGTMNSGRVDSVSVDIGDSVQKDQVVASVVLPSTLGTTQSGAPRLGYIGTENQKADVKSPIAGVVVARQSNPGDTVAAGQSVVTVVDPTNLWVQAQIDETKVDKVKVGQSVEVRLDSIGRTVTGKVTAVNRASSASFSLLPSSNGSGNFTRVTQWVPVKIAIDYGNAPLVMGSSAEIKIRVRD